MTLFSSCLDWSTGNLGGSGLSYGVDNNKLPLMVLGNTVQCFTQDSDHLSLNKAAPVERRCPGASKSRYCIVF